MRMANAFQIPFEIIVFIYQNTNYYIECNAESRETLYMN